MLIQILKKLILKILFGFGQKWAWLLWFREPKIGCVSEGIDRITVFYMLLHI